MGFIQYAADGAADIAVQRVRDNKDHGSFNPRPEIDRQQQAELQEAQRGGRTDEIYRQCLTYHGFRWFTVEQLPMLEGGVYRAEGEWRHAKLKLAFTPRDLASGYPLGPESLDTFLRDQKMALAVSKGRVPKQLLRKAREKK